MTKDEALKLALEALEADELDMVDDGSGNMVFRKEQAITAMEKLLAQPEQEPVAIRYDFDGYGYQYIDSGSGSDWQTRVQGEPLYTAPHPEQYPQIAINPEIVGYVARQRTWVGMSEEEKIQFMVDYYSSNWDTKTLIAVMDNYEAKLKDKNTRGQE